jgi:hypothetical protein
MVLSLVGASIECEKCELIARKIVPSSPQLDDTLGKVIKYECSRNSSAENIEELIPKEFKCKLSSNLDLGTKLQADGIYLITTKLKRIKPDIVNESGRHKASRATINAFTYAEIKYPLENVINSMNKRKELK